MSRMPHISYRRIALFAKREGAIGTHENISTERMAKAAMEKDFFRRKIVNGVITAAHGRRPVR